MPAASITINGSAGSDDNLPIGVLVQLDNQNTGGELTYDWTFLDQPPGPTDSFSNAAIRNPQFTPTKEGTYLIQLVVNLGLATEQSQKVIAAVRQLTTNQRIIAAGETTEDGVRGWAAANNANLLAINSLIANPGVIVGVNDSGGTLSTGQVVRVVALATIKAGLPGEQQVAGFDIATAATLAQVDELLCVVESAVTGGGTIANGELMNTRYIGIPLNSSGAPQTFPGTATVGDPVYLDDAGALSLTQGTVRRQLGSVADAGASTYSVWYNGVGGADITPVSVPYVVYGNPGTLPSALRIDGTNATGATGGVSPTFAAGDASTAALTAKRFSAAGADIFRVEDETGALLARFDATGKLYFGTGWYQYASGNNLLIRGPFSASIASGALAVNAAAGYTTLNVFSPGGIQASLFAVDSVSAGYVGTQTGHKLYLATGGFARWEVGASSGHLSAVSPALVRNLSTPLLGTDAANRDYVDNEVASLAADVAAVDQALTPPNFVINGRFDYWQRETSVGASSFLSTRVYGADRWYLSHTGTAATMSRDTSTIIGVPMAKVARSAGSTSTDDLVFVQEIDREMLKQLLGRTLKLSFVASAGANFSATSGVLSFGVVIGTGATTQNFISGYTGAASVYANSISLTPGAVPAQYQYDAGPTVVSTSATTMALVFRWTPTGTAGADDWVKFGQVMLSYGRLPTPDLGTGRIPYIYASGSYAQELALCQRYFEKSYELGVAVGTTGVNSGRQDASVPAAIKVNSGTPFYGTQTAFAARKWRTVATTGDVTFYSISNGLTGYIESAAGEISVGTSRISYANTRKFDVMNNSGSLITVPSSSDGWVLYYFHWTCDVDI